MCNIVVLKKLEIYISNQFIIQHAQIYMQDIYNLCFIRLNNYSSCKIYWRVLFLALLYQANLFHIIF